MKKPWMHITKWTKPNWKDYILWFQLYNIQEKSKLWRQYKDKWLAGVGPGSIGSEITLYESMMAEICHYTFVQTYRMYNTKNEPWCKLRTVVIMMCQCKFTNCKKCTILWGILIKGRAVHVLRERVYRKFL